LTLPGKSVNGHIQDALKCVRKEELSSRDIAKTFPMPRASEVDSDEWIDFDSMDQLEMKMNEIVGTSLNEDTKSDGASKNTDEKEKRLLGMDNMLKGLEKFVTGESDVKGVHTVEANGQSLSGDDKASHLDIDGRIYFKILHKALKTDDDDEVYLDDLVASNENGRGDDDSDLLNYFSKEDLAFEDEEEMGEEVNRDHSSDIPMHQLMREMDEQLIGSELEREYNVSIQDGHETSSEMNGLVADDPTAINASVLSNLLESLDAQGAASGPVSTLFTEVKNYMEDT